MAEINKEDLKEFFRDAFGVVHQAIDCMISGTMCEDCQESLDELLREINIWQKKIRSI